MNPMVAISYTSDDLWDRIERARQEVHDRLHALSTVLAAAEIQYVVIGEFAVQLWVATVDESAIRGVRDVDILLLRDDLTRATDVLTQAGFIYCPTEDGELFFNGD